MKYKGIQSADLQSKAIREVNEFTIKFVGQNIRKLYRIADKQFKQKYNRTFLKQRMPIIDFAEAVEINIKTDVFIQVRYKVRYVNSDDYKYIFINFVAQKKAYTTNADAKFLYNPMSIRQTA